MKCPQCGHDQKAKLGLYCQDCRYAFAFDPKDRSTNGVTDGKFVSWVRVASQNDTAWFTENQLYAAYCRKLQAPLWFGLCGAIVLFCLAVFVGMKIWPIGLFFGAMGAAVLASTLLGRTNAKKRARRPVFQGLLKQWKSKGKTIERMIEQPSLGKPPPEWTEPDIYNYGVERILLVDRDILVDLLVKNDLHAEHKMLVLAESGYPTYLQDIARRLLEENPELPVFLLHDASSRGVGMHARILAGGLLPLEGHPLTDLGMFPTDFQLLKRTQRYDPENETRGLPVDAMMVPFLGMGLAAAMASSMPMGTMIAQQQQGASVDGGFDFG